MSCGGQAPNDAGNGQPDPHAHLVGESAHARIPDGVGDAECKDDLAELALAEVQVTLDGRLQDPEQVPVHVIDRRHYEEQRDNDPPIVASRRNGSARLSGKGCLRHLSSSRLLWPEWLWNRGSNAAPRAPRAPLGYTLIPCRPLVCAFG